MKLLSDKQLANTHGGWWSTDQVAGAACAATVIGALAFVSLTFSPLATVALVAGMGLNSATCGAGLAATFVNSL